MPKDFPAKVTYNYYISTDTKNLYGDDVYITFKFISRVKGDYFKIYAVKKTDKGYIVMDSDSKAKDYIIPDITKWGFLKPVQLKEQNGQFTIEMKNSPQAYKLVSSNLVGMTPLCKYYKCYEDE